MLQPDRAREHDQVGHQDGERECVCLGRHLEEALERRKPGGRVKVAVGAAYIVVVRDRDERVGERAGPEAGVGDLVVVVRGRVGRVRPRQGKRRPAIKVGARWTGKVERC